MASASVRIVKSDGKLKKQKRRRSRRKKAKARKVKYQLKYPQILKILIYKIRVNLY